MGVLMVLWTVLKIILIIVLVLLMLMLLLTAVVLLARLDYGIKARYSDRLDMACRVSWLFGMVKATVTVKNDDVKFKVKLPFGLEKRFLTEENEEIKPKPEPVKEEKVEIDEEKPKKAGQTVASEEKTEMSVTDSQPEAEKAVKKKSEQKKKKKEEKKPFILITLWEKFKEIKEEYDIPVIIRLTIELIKDLLRAIGVKVCRINGVIGLSDPSNTGLVLGGIGIMSVYLPGEILFKGNFEKSEFKCNGVIEGRTYIFKFLWPVLKYIFKKPIWKVIKALLRKDDKNE